MTSYGSQAISEIRAGVGDLRAFVAVARLGAVARAAEALSQGDLSVQIAAKSDQDVLSQSFLRMMAYMQEIARAAFSKTGSITHGVLALRRRFSVRARQGDRPTSAKHQQQPHSGWRDRRHDR